MGGSHSCPYKDWRRCEAQHLARLRLSASEEPVLLQITFPPDKKKAIRKIKKRIKKAKSKGQKQRVKKLKVRERALFAAHMTYELAPR